MPAAAHLDDLAAFVTASPTSFHAVAELARRLRADGFAELDEAEPWALRPGRFFVIRDGALIAWRLPGSVQRIAFRVVGTHTDSPGFKLKPSPMLASSGWQQVGWEVYGGPLVNSWLDRELGLAGRVVDDAGDVHLVRTGPLLRIPQLAPHLDRSVNDELRLDRQAHLLPVLAVGRPDADVLAEVAVAAGLRRERLIAHDLYAYVVEPPARFGLDGMFLASPRLDNLSSVHAGLVALLGQDPTAAIPVLACFDNEEIGSDTRSGASGPFLADVLGRIAAGLGLGAEAYQQALARSLHVSADAGHAVHPNYAQLHDPGHRPLVNAGPLLKINANQRYASDAIGIAAWRQACVRAGVPVQEFVSNNAVPCGSTIGPLTATRLGVRTVDVGIPLLSMHSARELCGRDDPWWLAQGLAAFLAG